VNPIDQHQEQQRLERLRRLLGGQDTGWLVERVRRRIAAGAALTGTVSLANPTAQQRRALETLLGRRPGAGASIGVSLPELDTQLRRSGLAPAGLAAAVTELIGPITDRYAQRMAVETAWAQALAELSDLGGAGDTAAQWATDPATAGLIRRLAGSPATAASLVAALVRVLGALPATGVTLARFAAETTGDPHALDQGRPLSTLALAAIRAIWETGPSPDEAVAGREPETSGQRRRTLWDRVGVLVDELSSTVLLLNVPLSGAGLLEQLTGVAAQAGEPLVLTLRQVAREPVRWTVPVLYLCENPAVVAAAADQLGSACPALICVNGQPTAAVLRLVAAAAASQTRLRYHGDFDWGGLRIANLLHQRFHWQPWRFDTPAYTEAVAAPGRLGRQLAGKPVAAEWDPDLAGAMLATGRRVEEELVLADLLADLAAVASASGM
jgi:uncharacterized protein (TIGR02679 family)